jgi:HAE1 family hydrophobic/amphiphilic exporter-1
MTAISSIAGFMPLVVAAGAGAASRQAIGTAVVGGMIAATIMSLIFTPVFYVVMQRLSGLGKKKPENEPKPQKATADAQQALPEKSS